MSSTDQEPAPTPGDRLYQHSKRKQWGFAVLAWERDGKRGYQFEDGELRVFAKEFYGLLTEAECPPDQAARLLAKLGRQSGAGKGGGADGKNANEPLLTFAEQLQVFLAEHPEGFAGARWKDEHRGEGAPRRLKRHRDFAVADAAGLLSVEALDGLIAANDHAEVARRLGEIVNGSDLVTRAQAEPISRAAPSPELSRGVRDFLYGSGELESRFDELCRVLLEAGRKQLSWPLVTAVPALVRPSEHVAVRPTVLAKQSQWAHPRLRWGAKPDGKSYARILTMARTVRDALVGAGHPPKDLLDVYDFMLVTLRPAAAKILDEVRRNMALHDDAASPAADAVAEAAPDDELDDELAAEGALEDEDAVQAEEDEEAPAEAV
jgi:hypothetical protein